MVTVENLALVFVAGLLTALATGLGALPFFFVEEFGDRWNVALWGLASGIMVSASLFGLFSEGLAHSTGLPALLAGGILAGVVLVEVSDRVLDEADVGGSHDHDGVEADGGEPLHEEHALQAEAFAEGDLKKLALVLGILTIHSFPEGVAVGVSFADLGLEGGIAVLGASVPVLAVFMTVAISIHNVPEGTAIAIPMRAMGLSNWRMVGAAVFSSLPQPIGAVIAFAFVRWARAFLPFGFGFAAGAMVYLVLTEFVPEALETGEELPGGGRRELLAGFTAGAAVMLPLLFV
jgi:ZIP family zinc transporter